MAEQATPNLKVFSTVRWGYSYAFRHTPLMLRAGAPLFLYAWFVFIAVAAIIVLNHDQLRELSQPLFTWLFVPFMGHFAVAWHRAILLGEMKPRIFRFGRQELLYTLVFGLFMLLPDLLLTDRMIDALKGSPVAGLMVLVAYLVACGMIVLATPILPAVAIDDRRMKVTTIWRQLRGNWLRFITVEIIATLIGLLVYMVVVDVTSWIDGILWNLRAIDIGRAADGGAHFFRFVLVQAVITGPLALTAAYIIAATVGTLSIVYAGIVRRTLESDDGYVAVDRLARRLV